MYDSIFSNLHLLYMLKLDSGFLLSFIVILVSNFHSIKNFLEIFKFKKNKVIIEGKRIQTGYKSIYDDYFSGRFKAVWNYVNTQLQSNQSIYQIKEHSSYKYRYTDTEDKLVESNMFIVNQPWEFKLADDIKCRVIFNTSTNNSNDKDRQICTEAITIEIYSDTLSLYSIKTFIDDITDEYELKINNYRKNKKFIYMLFNKCDNSSDSFIWKEYLFTSSRTFDNLFFDGKFDLIQKIDFFTKNKNYYDVNGNPWTLGICLSGPPGTGKTEVAKIMGKIFSNLGVLKKNTFKKVTREDLVAGYLGQTSLKTKDVIKECIGGVLFIDEAYALGNKEKRDSFSKESIDTICEALSDYKKDFMCIIAGYEQELKDCFFGYNPGLESRFTWKFKIDDYSSKELRLIFEKKVIDCGWGFKEPLLDEWFDKNRKGDFIRVTDKFDQKLVDEKCAYLIKNAV